MLESLAPMRLWRIHEYCFPYRSLDRHRATRSHEDCSGWPWFAYQADDEDDARSALFPEPGFLEALALRQPHSPLKGSI